MKKRHIRNPKAASSNPFWVRIMVSKCIRNISPHAKDLHLSTTNWMSCPCPGTKSCKHSPQFKKPKKTPNYNKYDPMRWLQSRSHHNQTSVQHFYISLCLFGYLWPQWTSTHQHTIHWMPIITQLWMNLINRVNIWFHLGNQFCRK